MTAFCAIVGAALAALSTYEATNNAWAALAVIGGCILFTAAVAHMDEIANTHR